MGPTKLLILSKILEGIANNVVEEIIKHFKKNYLFDRDNKSSLGIYKQEVLLFKRYCFECSNGLRLMYCQRVADDIIALIDKLEMLNDKQQRMEIVDAIVSKKINVCIKQMKKVYNISDQLVFDQLINCHMIQHQKRDEHNVGMNSNASNGNLGQYDKLFNEGCLIFDTVDDNADSVLFTIYKIVFKHWSEILRLKIIKQQQFEFIQDNIKFFRSNIPKIIEKKQFKKLETLLDEIQQSAKERCITVSVVDDQKKDDKDETIDID